MNKSGKRGQAERAERAIQTRAMGKNDMRKFANQSKANVAWCLAGRLQTSRSGVRARTTVYASMIFNPFACCLYLMALVLVWYSSSQRAALIALTEGQLLMRCSLPANPTRKLGQICLLSSKSFWVKMGKMFFLPKCYSKMVVLLLLFFFKCL